MIVVFDSMCNVCNAFVRFLERRDHTDCMVFVAAQSGTGRQLLTRCGESPDDPATMIVIERDESLRRSDAVLAAIAALGGAWRGARFFRVIPRRLRDPLYDGFARRRYRWFGQANGCADCGDVAARARRCD